MSRVAEEIVSTPRSVWNITMRGISALLTGLFVASPMAAQVPTPKDWRGFDAYVARALKDWEVPGLSIAVVKDSTVAFVKGYGVRTVGGKDSVDTHTLFANASTTKAFTSLDVALMVDARKLDWDDPVNTRLPDFRLDDPYLTRALTLRDLLTHRVGFPDPYWLWGDGTVEFPEMMRRLQFMHPVSGWHPSFAYNNLTYAAAGEIAAQAAGQSWDDLTRSRILVPLGMSETVTTAEEAGERANLAMPHFRVDDTVRTITRELLDHIRPAGSMYSTASDMAKWIAFLLDSARVNGQRVVTAESYAQLFSPQALVSKEEFYPNAAIIRPNFTAYGMGWFLEDYRGQKVAFHTGSIDGYVAIVGLLPSRKAGVVVFANLDHAELRHALMYRVFDMFLGGPERDWSTEMRTFYGALQQQAKEAQQKTEQARVANTKPSVPLERYVGSYSDSLYGPVEVRLEGGALVLVRPGNLIADLDHWHYDTFRAVWRNRWFGKDLVSFHLSSDGQVASLDLGEGGTRTRIAESPTATSSSQ